MIFYLFSRNPFIASRLRTAGAFIVVRAWIAFRISYLFIVSHSFLKTLSVTHVHRFCIGHEYGTSYGRIMYYTNCERFVVFSIEKPWRRSITSPRFWKPPRISYFLFIFFHFSFFKSTDLNIHVSPAFCLHSSNTVQLTRFSMLCNDDDHRSRPVIVAPTTAEP
jgi:hypothetical protein